ncbi:MAG TPA: hypothetical protein VIA18_20185 [Polyangia bacterium]|nr:hypothetical protein [Polyangia bacterium]
MNIRLVIFAGLCSSVVSSLAFAEEQLQWGTPEQAAPCVNGKGFYDGGWQLHASDACKAEMARRQALCLKDERMKPADATVKPEVVESNCKHGVGFAIERDMNKFLDAAKDAAGKAKMEATAVPKADQRNPALEKAVAKAYAKDYPSGKIIKVVLGRWADDYEKDAFGRITGRDLYATVVNKQPDGTCQLHGELWLQHGKGKSFSGPLSARGSGSAEDSPILCSKAGGK